MCIIIIKLHSDSEILNKVIINLANGFSRPIKEGNYPNAGKRKG